MTCGEYNNYDNSEIIKLTDLNKFYMVQTIANSYINLFIQQDTEALYNILDPKYINEFNVTKENIYERLNIFNEQINTEDIRYYKLIIDKVYLSEYNEIGTYFVYGKIINTKTKEITSICLMTEIQITATTYYILPYEYMNKYLYTDIQIGTKYETHLDNIKDNTYNKCNYNDKIDDYTIIMDHMSKLKDELVYNLDASYNLFKEDYKKEKFDTIEKYKKYISNSMNSIIRSSIKKYNINVYSNYIEYVCIDGYGNYYIFQEEGVMDFTVKLDTYTIDTEEFKEKYNNSTQQQKVGMNLEKINQALNRKDYEYIYNKLDTTFKANNFATFEDFENYMKSTFFNINKIEYGDFNEQSGTYICETEITDNTRENENTIEKIFIMRLGENLNFTISFNI